MTFKSFYSPSDLSNTVIESMIVGRQDKRDFIRMDISSEINFCKTGSSLNFKGMTKDLSATGLRFETDVNVTVGDTLNVVVKPGVDITPPLEMTVAVVRVDKLENDTYQVAGVNQNPFD